MTPDEALDAIAAIMSGNEWSADTLDAIAEIVRSTSRGVDDADDGVEWLHA